MLKRFYCHLQLKAPSYFFRGKKKVQLLLVLVFLIVLLGTAWLWPKMDCSDENEDLIFAPSALLNERQVIPGPRILCVIGTYPKNFRTKLPHVIATWTGRCDSVVFITPKPTEEEEGYNGWDYVWSLIKTDLRYYVLEVAGDDSRNALYEHMKDALIKILDLYGDSFDFVFKCDDDTYVIMENLKRRLAQLDPNERIIMGAALFFQSTKYLSGGAGTAISRAGVQAIVKEGLSGLYQPCKLPVRNSKQLFVQVDDDVQLGECAKLLNFKILTSEDQGQMTFFPFPLETHLVSSLTERWWLEHTLECRETPSDACASHYPVTFHYVNPMEMYKFEYLLYAVKLHDNSAGLQQQHDNSAGQQQQPHDNSAGKQQQQQDEDYANKNIV